MSFHLVHILHHASRLSVDRGCLVCKAPEEAERRIPLSDILALIIVAKGVSFSGSCFSALLKSDAVILHCGENYRPIGKSLGLNRVVHSEIFKKQIDCDDSFSESLWKKLLKAKIKNQAVLLDKINSKHKLWEYLKENNTDEGNCARHYWKYYFSIFGRKKPRTREHQNAENPVNQLLNYSYAVMGAILHRSLIIHGLTTSLGIHHKYRFKSDPLLYDVLEPLRPICDFLLLRFHLRNKRRPLEDWIKFTAKEMLDFRIKVSEKKSLKLLYAIDHYASGIADCFYSGNTKELFIPKISELYFDNRD